MSSPNKYGHVVISNTKKGFVQSAIRFFTKSKFTHTLLTIPDCLDKQMAVEAASVGVAALPFDTFYRNNPEVSYKMFRFNAHSTMQDEAILLALESLQKGYGFLELGWFIWRGLNKMVGRDIRHKRNWSQAGIICSELVAKYICDSGSPHLFAEYGEGSVNAQDVLDICENNPALFELIESKD